MSLSQQLLSTQKDFISQVPDHVLKIMNEATGELSESGIVEAAPKTGDILLEFALPNQNGDVRELSSLTRQGPVVVTFYRGGWCPYCNLALRALQAVLYDIKRAGASLVAITPELPDESLSTIEKNNLGFDVLTDQNSQYTRSLGLVYTLPDSLKELYKQFGLNLEKHNGPGQFDLPLAATYVVGSDGRIISHFVDADYTRRKEPSEIIHELETYLEGAAL